MMLQQQFNTTVVCVQYFTESCINIGAIHLFNRSQLCHDGYWGSVHNTGWNEQDSYLVTCKQVGYHLKEDEVFGFGLLL